MELGRERRENNFQNFNSCFIKPKFINQTNYFHSQLKKPKTLHLTFKPLVMGFVFHFFVCMIFASSCINCDGLVCSFFVVVIFRFSFYCPILCFVFSDFHFLSISTFHTDYLPLSQACVIREFLLGFKQNIFFTF